MNRPRIDLNLLYIVHAIIAEGGISRAAHRLSLTQPAVSNALRRARVLFQDELLVRSGSDMKPTERALTIWPQLDAALERLADLIEPPSFDPSESTASFRISITASLEALLGPRLITRFVAEAPHATLNMLMHTNARSTIDLEQGRLHCAVGMFADPPETLKGRGVLRDQYVCVMRRDHPAKLPLTLDSFLDYRHIVAMPSGRPISMIDQWLENYGRSRDISVIVTRYEHAMRMAGQTDLIAVIPNLFAEAYASPEVVIAPLPLEGRHLVYKMLWHDRTDRIPAQKWIRSLIIDSIQQTFQGPKERGLAPEDKTIGVNWR